MLTRLLLPAVVFGVWALVSTIPATARIPAIPTGPGEEILIHWKDDITRQGRVLAEERSTLLTSLNARPAGYVPQLHIERWRLPAGTRAEALRVLESSPAVGWAEPNYPLQIDPLEARPPLPVPIETRRASPFPDDPYYLSYASRYLARLGVEEAWSLTEGDPRVVVAVVDTGVDCSHPDLAGRCWVNEDEIPGNGVDDDHNGYVDDHAGWNFVVENGDTQDVHHHGTHVAGILAADINNGEGIAGIAGKTTIMPLVVFAPNGTGTYYDLIRAILYAVDNGARVINLSLGATTYSRGEALAVAYAHRKGAVLVAAAGNNGFDRVFYPAAHPQVIGVAATDSNDNIAWFSNHGSYVSVAAPGVSIISTIPGGRYGILCGTSMATPHVSGLAALILARNPTLSPDEVRAQIQSHADDEVGPPSVDTPGWDPYYGFGRIHVGKAVSATVPAPFPPEFPSGEAPALPWPATCQDVLHNGDFEAGLAPWEGEHISLVETPVYEGERAVRLSAQEGAWLTQRFTLPARALQMTFFMAVRVETQDGGIGPSPTFPFDDWLTVTLESVDGTHSVSLIRTGNTSDGVRNGLAWDEMLAILPASEWAPLRGQEVRLLLQTGDDGDSLATTFVVDAVRLCVVEARWQRRFNFMPIRWRLPSFSSSRAVQ